MIEKEGWNSKKVDDNYYYEPNYFLRKCWD